MPTYLEQFRFSPNRGNALSFCFHAIPDGKPVPTFPGIALNPDGRERYDPTGAMMSHPIDFSAETNAGDLVAKAARRRRLRYRSADANRYSTAITAPCDAQT
jgi:hypothetical protein